MKNLLDYINESILDDDNIVKDITSKHAEKTFISAWADKNIPKIGKNAGYELDKNNKIVNWGGERGYNLNLSHVKEDIPSLIKFGSIYTGVFFGKSLKYMEQNQIPEIMNGAYIHSSIGTIQKCILNIQNILSIQAMDGNKLKIDDLTINIIKNAKQKHNYFNYFILDLHEVNIDLKNLQNIHIGYGECDRINMIKTPASEEIYKNIKKLKDNNQDISPYLDEVFKEFKGLKLVDITPRYNLQYFKNLKKWGTISI